MVRLEQNDSDALLTQARLNPETGLGPLLEKYRSYLSLLARVQIGRRLQGKADSADLQETFLEAHRHFLLFQGQTAAEFVHWLRQILAGRLAKLVRRYLGTKGRNVRLEQEGAHLAGRLQPGQSHAAIRRRGRIPGTSATTPAPAQP
jgi:RNA polymerase sigma-70 factor (ECF subfamily)